MASNRISQHLLDQPEPAPQPGVAATLPQGFAFCPPQFLTGNGWQQEIYRLAYERAQAAAQVPLHHRRLFSVWN